MALSGSWFYPASEASFCCLFMCFIRMSAGVGKKVLYRRPKNISGASRMMGRTTSM